MTNLILRMRKVLVVALGMVISLGHWQIFALETMPVFSSVSILNISDSGRSLILDRGRVEGLRVGMKARLLFQEGPDDRPRLRTVGYAEVIKADPTHSYWYLHELELGEAIRKGQKLVYILQDRSLQSWQPPRIRQKKVIYEEGKTLLDHIYEQDEGMPRELVHSDDSGFETIEGTEVLPHTQDYDLKTTNFDFWSEQKGLKFINDYMDELEKKHIVHPESVTDAKSVRQRKEREVFESYVQSIVNTINSAPHGLHSLYERNMNLEARDEIRQSALIENTYQKQLRQRSEKIKINPRAVAKIEREGGLWSADLNDRALREFMLESGIAEEERRQRQLLDEIQGHELIFRYSSSLNRFASEGDPNFQGMGYSISLGYEYQLARFFKFARSLTMEFELQRSINFYEMAPEINGRFSEGSVGVGFNYYFYNEPYTLHKPALYVGMAFKRGNADGGSSLLEEQKEYKYQFMSLPSFYLGAKYRFRAGDGHYDQFKLGMGLNFLFAIENKQFSVVDTPLEGVQSRLTVRDNKFAIGLSFFF